MFIYFVWSISWRLSQMYPWLVLLLAFFKIDLFFLLLFNYISEHGFGICQFTGVVSPLSSLLLETGFHVQLPVKVSRHIYQTSWIWLPPASEILRLEIPGSLWTPSVSLYSGNPSSILDTNSAQTQPGVRLLSAKIIVILSLTCTIPPCVYSGFTFSKNTNLTGTPGSKTHVHIMCMIIFVLSKMLSYWYHPGSRNLNCPPNTRWIVALVSYLTCVAFTMSNTQHLKLRLL